MPTYEYECDKCGNKFELFQSMTEKPRTKCPKCGGKVRRLIGAGAGLLFKGTGFHATDYPSCGASSCPTDSPCCGLDSPCNRSPRNK